MQAQTQLVFGDPKSRAERDKENGMHAAGAHADQKVVDWSQRAYEKLQAFLNATGGREFMAEDVRMWCWGGNLPEPPSKRAWGSVITRAVRQGLIKFSGYAKTTNPKAHRTPAALWVKN